MKEALERFRDAADEWNQNRNRSASQGVSPQITKQKLENGILCIKYFGLAAPKHAEKCGQWENFLAEPERRTLGDLSPSGFIPNLLANFCLSKKKESNAFILKSMESFSAVEPKLNERDCYENAALHYVAHQGNLDLGWKLVALGAFVDVEDNFGNTPLLIAAFFGHDLLFRFLFLLDADVNRPNKAGITARELCHISMPSLAVELESILGRSRERGQVDY